MSAINQIPRISNHQLRLLRFAYTCESFEYNNFDMNYKHVSICELCIRINSSTYIPIYAQVFLNTLDGRCANLQLCRYSQLDGYIDSCKLLKLPNRSGRCDAYGYYIKIILNGYYDAIHGGVRKYIYR